MGFGSPAILHIAFRVLSRALCRSFKRASLSRTSTISGDSTMLAPPSRCHWPNPLCRHHSGRRYLLICQFQVGSCITRLTTTLDDVRSGSHICIWSPLSVVEFAATFTLCSRYLQSVTDSTFTRRPLHCQADAAVVFTLTIVAQSATDSSS